MRQNITSIIYILLSLNCSQAFEPVTTGLLHQLITKKAETTALGTIPSIMHHVSNHPTIVTAQNKMNLPIDILHNKINYQWNKYQKERYKKKIENMKAEQRNLINRLSLKNEDSTPQSEQPATKKSFFSSIQKKFSRTPKTTDKINKRLEYLDNKLYKAREKQKRLANRGELIKKEEHTNISKFLTTTVRETKITRMIQKFWLYYNQIAAADPTMSSFEQQENAKSKLNFVYNDLNTEIKLFLNDMQAKMKQLGDKPVEARQKEMMEKKIAHYDQKVLPALSKADEDIKNGTAQPVLTDPTVGTANPNESNSNAKGMMNNLKQAHSAANEAFQHFKNAGDKVGDIKSNVQDIHEESKGIGNREDAQNRMPHMINHGKNLMNNAKTIAQEIQKGRSKLKETKQHLNNAINGGNGN